MLPNTECSPKTGSPVLGFPGSSGYGSQKWCPRLFVTQEGHPVRKCHKQIPSLHNIGATAGLTIYSAILFKIYNTCNKACRKIRLPSCSARFTADAVSSPQHRQMVVQWSLSFMRGLFPTSASKLNGDEDSGSSLSWETTLCLCTWG